MTLDEAKAAIGASVMYEPDHRADGEDGTIVRCSDAYVFVLYVGDRSPKATRPGDLTFLATAPAPSDLAASRAAQERADCAPEMEA